MKYVQNDGFIVAAGVSIGFVSKIWIGFIVGIILHYIRFDKTDDQTEHKTRSNQLPINTCPNIQPSNNEIEMQHELNNRG